jgi:hypothetical protein
MQSRDLDLGLGLGLGCVLHFTSWSLCCRLVLVGGGEDDHIRSAQVSGEFEMQQRISCTLMLVVNVCCDLYLLVCELARSKLTSFVSWGLDLSRDDDEAVRGLVPFGSLFWFRIKSVSWELCHAGIIVATCSLGGMQIVGRIAVELYLCAFCSVLRALDAIGKVCRSKKCLDFCLLMVLMQRCICAI